MGDCVILIFLFISCLSISLALCHAKMSLVNINKKENICHGNNPDKKWCCKNVFFFVFFCVFDFFHFCFLYIHTYISQHTTASMMSCNIILTEKKIINSRKILEGTFIIKISFSQLKKIPPPPNEFFYLLHMLTKEKNIQILFDQCGIFQLVPFAKLP